MVGQRTRDRKSGGEAGNGPGVGSCQSGTEVKDVLQGSSPKPRCVVDTLEFVQSGGVSRSQRNGDFTAVVVGPGSGDTPTFSDNECSDDKDRDEDGDTNEDAVR